MALLSRILILLAILLYEQYTHHTQASLCPKMQYLSAKQYAYQSFLSYFLVWFSFSSKWHAGCILDKHVYINRTTVIRLQCMKVFGPTIQISGRKVIGTVFALKKSRKIHLPGPSALMRNNY